MHRRVHLCQYFSKYEKDRSVRPGSGGENAVGKGKSPSKARCRPLYKDTSFVSDRPENS